MANDIASFDILPLQVWTASVDGRLIYVNPCATDYFCVSAARLLEEGWMDFCHPQDLNEAVRRWSHSLETGQPYEAVFRLQGGVDRQYRWHVARAVPMRDGGDAIVGWVGTNTEVDLLKRSEEIGQASAVRAQHARAEVDRLLRERDAVLEQLAEGVIITDKEGRIRFVNQAAEKLHGCALLDVPPEHYADAYHLFTEYGEPYPPHELPLARAILGDETVRDARWQIRRADGSVIIAQGSAQPLRGPQGEKIGAVLTVREAPAG